MARSRHRRLADDPLMSFAMNDDEYLQLRQRVAELRAASPDAAERVLNERFNSAVQDLLSISGMLSEHYAMTDNLAGQERHRRLGSILCPEEPLAWTTLTEFLIFTKQSLQEAEEAAQNALKCAEKTGEYVRLCYNNFARIARRKNDYKRLEECLRFLVNYTPPSGKRDIAYEADFLVGIDDTKIDQRLLKQYEAIASAN